MFGLGLPEVGIITAMVIVLFGASRLPQIGSSLGQAISGFRNAMKDPGQHLGEIEKTEKNKI